MLSAANRLGFWLGALAVLTMLMVGYPVVSVVLRSISEGEIGTPLTTRWLAMMTAPGRNLDALFNTVVYAAGASMLSMAVGVGLAVLSIRTDMPGGRWIGLLSLMPMLVPPFILVVGWVAMADPNAGFINILASLAWGAKVTLVDVNTMTGIIWVTGLFLAPYVYLLAASGLSSGDPAAEEAARVCGAGAVHTRMSNRPSERPSRRSVVQPTGPRCRRTTSALNAVLAGTRGRSNSRMSGTPMAA